MQYGGKQKRGNFLKKDKDNVEQMVMVINNRIEALKTEYNLFFAGEIRVPPEREREALEKAVRNILYKEYKAPTVRFLIQNMSQRFALYNNMWKKKLNEIETGALIIQKKRAAYMEDQEAPKKKKKLKGISMDISLNREDSFDKFYDTYNKLLKKKGASESQKEKLINSLKTKLITSNLVDAKVSLSVSEGKLKLKIKG